LDIFQRINPNITFFDSFSTRGTYGYIDPDGNKREYHYETGIKCDPNNRNNEEDKK